MERAKARALCLNVTADIQPLHNLKVLKKHGGDDQKEKDVRILDEEFGLYFSFQVHLLLL